MNSDRLNYIIKNKSNGNNDLSLHLHQMFFFEHILMRLEHSKYKDNIILKGGVLLSSIIGNDMRTTKDIDATLKSIPLNKEKIKTIFEEILHMDLSDGCDFEIESIKDIRLEDEYGGYRINVYGTFDKLKSHFFIEITTGDVITPREIKYEYNSIFEDKKIYIMAYTVETIIAEKFESIISKNITNTRAKDFYDIYMLMNNHKNKINDKNLISAIKRTFKHRNTNYDIKYLNEVFDIIKDNLILKQVYDNYKNKLIYVKNINYEDTIKTIYEIISILEQELVSV